MSGCIQEIEVFKKSQPILVVDGLLTNEPGPHHVKLSFSKTYGESQSYERIEEAMVKIVDDSGHEEILTYSGDGKYSSSADFNGEIGRIYHLDIMLNNGARYKSQPEKLSDVPTIDNMTYEINNLKITFYINYTDDVEKENFYRWRYRDTYEVVAPLAHTYKPDSKSSCHKKDNFGQPIFDRNSNCWVTLYDYEFLKIDRDLFYNGRQMKNVKIYQIDFDHRLNLGYDAQVLQYSMTKDAYRYWKAIEDQIGNNGTIFETPNYHIKGNIYSINQGNTNPVGYFGASAVSKARVFISEYINQFEPVNCEPLSGGCYPERCIDCTKYRGTSFPVKPDFWPY